VLEKEFVCQSYCTNTLYSVSPVSIIPPPVSTTPTNNLYSFPLSVRFHHYSIFCFSLSVPFHHYSIFCSPRQYHSTNTLYSVPPVSSIPPILNILFPPLSTIPPLLYILFPLSVPFHHYSIFCSPCQYHSTITLYSVPPVSPFHHYSIFCFPLSVRFHQYCIFCFPSQYHCTNTLYSVSSCQYHSTITLYSDPAVSTIPSILYILCSPVSVIPRMLYTHFDLNTTLIRRTSGRRLETFKESEAR